MEVRICRLVAFFLRCQAVNSSLFLCSLSGGRCASILEASRNIPKKGRQVVGPSTFSRSRCTPSSLHTFLIMSKFA